MEHPSSPHPQERPSESMAGILHPATGSASGREAGALTGKAGGVYVRAAMTPRCEAPGCKRASRFVIAFEAVGELPTRHDDSAAFGLCERHAHELQIGLGSALNGPSMAPGSITIDVPTLSTYPHPALAGNSIHQDGGAR